MTHLIYPQNVCNSRVAFYLFLLTYSSYSQTYFSKRLDPALKSNLAATLKLYDDTLFIPAQVFETPGSYSSCMLKITKTGTIISQKRFKPANKSYEAGNDFLIKNNKFYVTSITADPTKLQSGFYIFNKACDTIFTRNYGDTNYYNFGFKIQPFNQTKDKFLLIGETDSTCGPGHLGYYKPILRVVDTNGTLYQTKLYLTNNKYRTLTGSDTTLNKGYIICGAEQLSSALAKPYILKIDSNLNQNWVLYLTNNSRSYYCDVTTLKNGKHIVSHNSVDSISGSNFFERIVLTKLDTNGSIIWQKYYGIKQQEISSTTVRELSNNDLIVSGSRRVQYTSSVSQVMGFIMKIDSSGNLKWWNNYIPISPIKDTIADCYLYDVIQMSDGGFAATGWADPSGYFGTKQETWLLRVDSMGCIVPGCNPLGTAIEEKNVENIIIKAYPNPFSDELNVSYNLTEKYKGAVLQLVEPSTGRVLVNSTITEPRGTTNFKMENISEGVYLVRIKREGAEEKNIKVVNIK